MCATIWLAKADVSRRLKDGRFGVAPKASTKRMFALKDGSPPSPAIS
jgi:hypothetical protein